MTGLEMINLIEVGAIDRLRNKLKKLGLPERMKALDKCLPFIKEKSKVAAFFREYFAIEIGSIVAAHGDLDRAVEIYRKSIK